VQVIFFSRKRRRTNQTFSKPTPNEFIVFSLKDKIALVTGRRVGPSGAAIAETFVQSRLQRFGLPTAMKKTVRAFAEHIGGKFTLLDVANETDCGAGGAKRSAHSTFLAKRRWHRPRRHTCSTLSAVDLDKLYAVNVRGIFNCCKAFAPLMLELKAGSVINMGVRWRHRGCA